MTGYKKLITSMDCHY